MYNKQNLYITLTWLILVSYMTTHIDKSPIMAQENTCAGPESWARENRFLLSFIFRYNVWLLTLAKILITHGCWSPVLSQPQDVFSESGTRGSNEHTRHGTYTFVQHGFHLRHENIRNAHQHKKFRVLKTHVKD